MTWSVFGGLSSQDTLSDPAGTGHWTFTGATAAYNGGTGLWQFTAISGASSMVLALPTGAYAFDAGTIATFASIQDNNYGTTLDMALMEVVNDGSSDSDLTPAWTATATGFATDGPSGSTSDYRLVPPGTATFGLRLTITLHAGGNFAGGEQIDIGFPTIFEDNGPADETGYCLTTLHDLAANRSNFGMAPLTGVLYIVNQSNFLDKLDLGTFAYTTNWVTAIDAQSLCAATDGNLYVSGGSKIYKVTTTGVVTVLHDFAATADSVFYITFGRDGNLYCNVEKSGHVNAVYQVTLGGVATHIGPLDSTGDFNYDWVAALSDGTVWVTLDPPDPSSSPNLNVNTTFRRYRPSVPDVADIPIQALVDRPRDGPTEAYGGIFCDADDNVIVPMVTFQGNGTTRADLSWFLRVAPDGTATRIASTWDYGGSPPPAATLTNVADGPLGTSLACENDQGAGMSLDGTTLYFIDDGDQNNGVTGNLLRILKKCAAASGFLHGGAGLGPVPAGTLFAGSTP